MFQDTPYTSPEWLLAIYILTISVARLPFLHGQSCISALDTFFRMTLLPAGKPDFFGALICLSRLLGWPKRAYAFFPEYIQEKTHTPFLAKGIIVHGCRFSCAFKAIRIYLLKSVSCNSALLSNPLRCLPSIYLWTRVIIYNSASL